MWTFFLNESKGILKKGTQTERILKRIHNKFEVNLKWIWSEFEKFLRRPISKITNELWSKLVKNFEKFTGKHQWQRSFFCKVAGWRPVTLLKRGSSTVVYLWYLRKFQEFLFCKSVVNSCLWNLKSIVNSAKFTVRHLKFK